MPSLRTRLTRRAFVRSFGAATLGALALGGNTFAYGRLLEPGWYEIARVPVALPGLAAPFAGYRIAQISDIHFDNVWMTRARLAEIVGAVNRQSPDLIAITFADISAATGRFALQLSGHSHGGQISLPLLGPPLLPVTYCPRSMVGFWSWVKTS